MKRLANKVAVITGAASGIGAATAKLFSYEGAKVVIADLRAKEAEQTAASIRDAGGDAIAIPTDISNAEQVQVLFEKTIDIYGYLNILHCNAGVLMIGSADTPSDEHWYKTLSVNLTGTYLCVKYGIPKLKQTQHSTIIITSSVSGLMGEPDLMAYDTVKGGLVNLTRQLAVEYAKDGIRVNSVCPGWIDTPFNDPIYELTPLDESSLGEIIPLARQGTPAEIAYAVLFLASEEASYITGHNLVVDGGLTAKL
ncbi:3-oxoacyl-(acyl-carrier-protein) reductase [Stanieria cyanosphaera PCC 7437]|uniref:3-oxoacyl-(Acyl-carrier-protein) reductase n=1 Tax=Stanieria cyanosphaera (strain ATCC 29371 / PCC 7437) TaxID=111780 RepID=K9XZV4_STAC7|nr:glucose 1-dehydrogenase [Stanieria cyanosphaera]AFZ37661.1 3-oxoacyl-(acyl-carrier-protein) reductase [Stanieria cyanosphaera PCC 7437]